MAMQPLHLVTFRRCVASALSVARTASGLSAPLVAKSSLASVGVVISATSDLARRADRLLLNMSSNHGSLSRDTRVILDGGMLSLVGVFDLRGC